jgi:hypothetical protein
MNIRPWNWPKVTTSVRRQYDADVQARKDGTSVSKLRESDKEKEDVEHVSLSLYSRR